MKPIQLQKTTIDIPFVDADGKTQLIIEFDRSDDNIKRLYDSFDELEKAKNDLAVTENEDIFEDTRAYVKKTMDPIFGEGTFDKVYALSPSVLIVVVYFYQMAMALKEELEMDDFKNFEDKYLN